MKVIEALRQTNPTTTIEILTPDFRNKHEAAVEAIVAARPDVYNHNLETVPRLYPTIRPGARYYASLRLLETVKKLDPSIFTKSGIMLGLGEAAPGGASGDGRHALGRYRFPDHGPVSPADPGVTPRSRSSSRPQAFQAYARDCAGPRAFCRSPRQPAHALQLSCRRGFREDARGPRGEAGQAQCRAKQRPNASA